MKISIAICTYNGEKYIAEQINSILNQTLKPDEIIVCDDRSTDNTIKILEEIRQKSSVPVSIFINEKNLGVTKNFHKAIALCKSEYVALSDQDDVWLPEKLEKMVGFLEDTSNRKINVVFTDMLLVDDNLQSLNKTMWDFLGFNEHFKNKWKKKGALNLILERGNVAAGAAMVFRRDYVVKLLPAIAADYKIMVHDWVIAILAAKDKCIAFLDIITVWYRQHIDQAIGTRGDFGKTMLPEASDDKKKNESKEEIALRIKMEIDYVKFYLEEYTKAGLSAKDLKPFHNQISHFEARENLPEKRIRRIPVIFREFFSMHYYKYSRSMFLATIRDFMASSKTGRNNK